MVFGVLKQFQYSFTLVACRCLLIVGSYHGSLMDHRVFGVANPEAIRLRDMPPVWASTLCYGTPRVLWLQGCLWCLLDCFLSTRFGASDSSDICTI